MLFKQTMKLTSLAHAIILSVATMAAGSAAADTLPIYNTGVNNGGAVLSVGQIDPHWQITAGPGVNGSAPAYVSNAHPIYTNTSDSHWIWLNPAANGPINVNFTFTQTIDLTGFDPATARISGNWGVDNTGFITLNDSGPVGSGSFALSNVVLDNFTSLHQFTINGGFHTGINTLEFHVQDAGNPAGLNVSNLTLSANPVPEPETWALMLAGLASVAALAKRRQAKA